MEFIINSTLVTATGLLVIGIWTMIGYALTRLWYYLTNNAYQISAKTIMGILGGPITAICMLFVAFVNLIPDFD
jgi:hypothetical protein